MHSRNKKALITLLLLLAALAAGLIFLPDRQEEKSGSPASSQEAVPVATAAAIPPDPLLEASAGLRRSNSPDEARSQFTLLRQRLKAMPAEQVVTCIRSYLEKGDDVKTKLEFALGRDRRLCGWPSLRVFLIDLLEEIDPSAAIGLSREVLKHPTNPDEWAAAMKNIGRQSEDDEDLDLLAAKAREMLGKEAWSRAPSPGYLEAFDAIVHSRDTSFVPPLLDRCADRQNQGTRHAAFLALDRLVQNSPEPALELLVSQAAAHPESCEMIANMVARADVRNPAQRRAVEVYLLDPRRTPQELASFASVFPNANQVVSVNLITSGDLVSGMDLGAIDRASLDTVRQWKGDPRFGKLQDILHAMERRIGAFVR